MNEVPLIIEMAFNKRLSSGMYNIQGAETLTVKEIVELIHHVLGKGIPDGCFGTAQRTDVGMKYLALDGLKLKNAISFNASISIREVIHQY